jgi:hypothetical protein
MCNLERPVPGECLVSMTFAANFYSINLPAGGKGLLIIGLK